MGENSKDKDVKTGININLDGVDFINLNPKIQDHLIEHITKKDERKNGMFERIFGYTKDVASIYVAFVICILSLILCIFIKDGEYFDKGLSMMALFIGYIFGVGNKQ